MNRASVRIPPARIFHIGVFRSAGFYANILARHAGFLLQAFVCHNILSAEAKTQLISQKKTPGKHA
jgi:hypothetical protein